MFFVLPFFCVLLLLGIHFSYKAHSFGLYNRLIIDVVCVDHKTKWEHIVASPKKCSKSLRWRTNHPCCSKADFETKYSIFLSNKSPNLFFSRRICHSSQQIGFADLDLDKHIGWNQATSNSKIRQHNSKILDFSLLISEMMAVRYPNWRVIGNKKYLWIFGINKEIPDLKSGDFSGYSFDKPHFL